MDARHLIVALLLGAAGLAAGCAGTGDSARPATSATSATPASAPATRAEFAVTSAAFEDGSPIPADYAMTEAGGRNVSIPLSWNNPPKGTRSFAIETVDMHPVAQEWVHWFVVDIPPETGEVAEGASGSAMPKGARELGNGFGATGWGGPAPPPGTGVHEYRTTVYALDTPTVDVPQNATIDEYRAAVVPRALATAQISGTFER